MSAIRDLETANVKSHSDDSCPIQSDGHNPTRHNVGKCETQQYAHPFRYDKRHRPCSELHTERDASEDTPAPRLTKA
jgi:hypothetical protein